MDTLSTVSEPRPSAGPESTEGLPPSLGNSHLQVARRAASFGKLLSRLGETAQHVRSGRDPGRGASPADAPSSQELCCLGCW